MPTKNILPKLIQIVDYPMFGFWFSEMMVRRAEFRHGGNIVAGGRISDLIYGNLLFQGWIYVLFPRFRFAIVVGPCGRHFVFSKALRAVKRLKKYNFHF